MPLTSPRFRFRTPSPTTTGPVIVRFRGIAKSFDGETRVVDDLDLDVARGEFLTLLGPSGSGKTTLLMMLAGFERPSQGTIELDGRPVHDLPPHKRDIGVVFQHYALFPHMTVAENVAFPLELRRRPKAEIAARVGRALDLVRLSDFGRRRPAQLSGGQQQRVAMARALVFEPKLVLMDEPLGALDKQLRERMQIEIRHIHERLGVTFVYVTHDQAEALTMSDRIAVFDRGRVQQLDTPERLYEAPANAFVAHFIGENNRLAGRVAAIRGDRCRVDLAGGVELLATLGVPLAVGDATTVSLRPERVLIAEAAAGRENQHRAEVVEVIYLGDHSRLRLRVFGGDGFEAKVPSAMTSRHFAAGATVAIGFDAKDCLALDHDARD